jgi:hypothetical protein
MTAAAYRTDVRGLAALLVRLRMARPALTIRAAATAPAAPPTQAGDDAVVSKHHHIYMSDQPEPGQSTTALGRIVDETIVVPVERPVPAEQTRVINTYGVERALATEILEEPLLFNLLADELGYPAYDPPVEPADLVAAARDTTGDLVRLPVRAAHLGDA